jgi:cell filamentation protein, protein adenylyltransferase
MQIKVSPNYITTSKIANSLMRIEAVKEKILHLPLTATILTSLRETARLLDRRYMPIDEELT